MQYIYQIRQNRFLNENQLVESEPFSVLVVVLTDNVVDRLMCWTINGILGTNIDWDPGNNFRSRASCNSICCISLSQVYCGVSG